MSQESDREFSSIYVFRVKSRFTNTNSNANLNVNTNTNASAIIPDINEFSQLLMKKAFRFEPDNYQPGFAKPAFFDRRILLVPYYDIAEQQITEDITNKEKPGEVIPQTKIEQVQKLRYIIDDNIYTNQGLIFVCKVDTLDYAQQVLEEYLGSISFYRNCVHNFVYSLSSGILQRCYLHFTIIGLQLRVRPIDQKHINNGKEQFRKFYVTQGMKLLPTRISYLGKKLGVKVRGVRVLDLRNRWASKSDAGLNFHWKIMLAPIRIIDYVIVHELAHYLQEDHSIRFWEVIEPIIPNYNERKNWLRLHGASLDV